MNPVHSGVASRAGFAHPARNIAALGIEPGMKVADFGAGSGAYALAIAEALLGSGTVYAIDIQKDLLRRIKNEATRRHFNNVEVLWGDLEIAGGSKISEETVNLVLISNLLFQLGEKQAVFAEAKRILKPHGRLVVIDWSDAALSKGDVGRVGPQKDAVVTKNAAIQLAEGAGLRLVDELNAGAHHYGLIFTRAHAKKGARTLVVH